MKKRISLFLVMTLMLSLALTGCASKPTSEELVMGTFDTMKNMENGNVKIYGDFNAKPVNPSDEKISADFEVNLSFLEKGKEFVSEIKAGANGMTIEMYSQYINKEFISSVPFLLQSNQYVKVTQDDISEATGYSIEDIEQKQDQIDLLVKKEEFIKHLASKDLSFISLLGLSSEVAEETIQLNGKDVKVNTVQMNMTLEDLEVIMKELVYFVNEDAELLELMETEKLSDEDLQDTINDITDLFAEAKDMVVVNNLTVKMSYDNKNNIVKESFVANIDVNEEDWETGQFEKVGNIELNLFLEFTNINELKELPVRTINEEDILPLEDIFGGFGY